MIRKYNREMLLPVEGDTDVKMMCKGNDEHGYLYVGGDEGPLRRVQAGVATCEGRVGGGKEGNVCCRSGRNEHNGVEVGLPYCHALAVIAKTNLWVYDYVHPIYKTTTQKVIYNQLVHPMEMHDMRKVDEKMGDVVGGEELDDDYYRCILPSNNGRHLRRPPSKRTESQTQDKKVRRCSKCGKVDHTRRTCCNPRVDFDATYEGNVVQIEDLLDPCYVAGISTM